MTKFLDELVAQRSAEPREDLISRLATRYVRAGELTHEELVAMARFILVAGHETTAHQISLSVLSLLRDPAQLAELRADESLFKPAVEELLRYWSISQDNQVRAAVAEVELGGATIRKGDGVIVAIPAANHDESVYPGADRVDIHRDAAGHLAFGFGAHLCPGASLARMELEVCLKALFTASRTCAWRWRRRTSASGRTPSCTGSRSCRSPGDPRAVVRFGSRVRRTRPARGPAVEGRSRSFLTTRQ